MAFTFVGVVVEPRMKLAAAAAVAWEAAIKKRDSYQVEPYLCSLRMKDREQVHALQQQLK